jgi:PAS domain S-box-containing protein
VRKREIANEANTRDRLPTYAQSAISKSPIGPLLAHHPVWRRYCVVAALIVVVAALRDAAVPVMGAQAPLLPFAFAVFAAAYLGGRGPALAATALAAALATLLFAEFSGPRVVLAWAGHVALFVSLGFLVSWTMDRLQRSYVAQQETLFAAKAGEEQLRTITDAMPALIAYVDSEHRYRFNNKGYQDWFGLRCDELLDRSAREVLGDSVYGIVKPRMEAALSGQYVDFETDVPYRTGGIRHVSAHYVPDAGADGVVRGYFALVEDVTERKQKEQLLADERLRLSLAMRAGRSGTFDWNIVTNQNSWSQELLDLHGFAPGKFDGSHEAWLAILHPDDLARVAARSELALKEGEITLEFRIRRHDTGEVRWLHARGKVFYDADHKPVRMLGINVDITEQKRAEEMLREADRRKDEFLAMLAHELRSPLSPIRNVAHILTDQRADIATLRYCGELVQRQVINLARLVDDLLDVARMRQGALEIRPQPVDLAVVIERAVETALFAVGGGRQSLRFVRLSHPMFVRGDPVRLEQVFANLLANASKFSPASSKIEIATELLEDCVVVRVIDEGIGIDPQMLRRVFDLFVQGDQSLDRPLGGLGIGLTLVKKIVELHGGTVEAMSQGIGSGSEFVVRLPRASESPAPLMTVPTRADRSRARHRILIVEDNKDAIESLQILLRLAGHEVVAATTGFDALEALGRFAPEWIFTDIGLPGLDGYALAGMIRHHPNGKTPRLYAVTGYGRQEDRALALQAGFDGHLVKPVDPSVLLGLLENQAVESSRSPAASTNGEAEKCLPGDTYNPDGR